MIRLSLVTDRILVILRSFWYKIFFSKISKKFRVLGSIKVYSPENIVVGAFTTINHGCILNARAPIVIGDWVHLSPAVIINTGGLDYTQTCENRTHTKNEVRIEDGVWIGSGAIINPGVTLGKNCVVGAGAVVTKDFPANCVVTGVPARILKEI